MCIRDRGTPAAKMDYPDEDTARRRAEIVMDIQDGIMEEFNTSRIGTVTRVLVEDFDGTYYFGRSFAESPDIDGRIMFTSDDLITEDFADVVITDIIDGEPFGKKYQA